MAIPSVQRWLKQIVGRGDARRRPRSWRLAAVPRLEVLEDRTLPSLFGPAQFFATGPGPVGVAVGDFNHDAIPDLAAANELSNTVSVLLGNGSGGFGPATNFNVGSSPRSVAVGDFNHDGNLDLAMANTGDNTVSVLLGDGSGKFGPATSFNVGSYPTSVAVGDFNNDGIPDLAVANGLDGTVSLLLGNGGGGFGPATNFSVGSRPFSVAVGDFNHDGNLDLAVANTGDTAVSVLLGDGSGRFGPATNFPVGSKTLSVAVGDFNHDGIPDLAVTHSGGDTVSVLLGNGSGGFGLATDFTVGLFPYGVAVGDFNHDGIPDLAVANADSNTVSVLLGDGSGGFGPATNFKVGSFPSGVAVGDFNHDGAPDLVVTNFYNNSVAVLLNQTPVTTTALSSLNNPTVAGQLTTLTATVTQAVPQTAQPTGLVTFKDGATILGTGTLNPSGTATLDFFTPVTGYHSLTAVYQGDPNFTSSTSSVVNQLVNQAATTTTLSASANPGLAGQPITFTAVVSPLPPVPGFGQPTGTVFFQDGATPLGSAALVNGSATLTTAALTAGAHAISAVYAGDNSFTAGTSAILAEAINNPAPVITSVTPGTLNEGSPGFTLTIAGNSFMTGATVQWKGTPLTITDLSSTQILATVPAALLTDEGTAQVSVTNPGGGASLVPTFTIADAPLTANGSNISVAGSKNFSGVVATFTDANPAATAADFSAVITWDNGSADIGTIGGTGPFTVSGSRKFGSFNNAHQVTVVITDRGGSTVTVTDTIIDPVAATPNQHFVAKLYQDLLQRPADDAGLASWSSMLDKGASRAQVVRDLQTSVEYRTDEVQGLYQRYLHRAADPTGLASLTQSLAQGGTLEQAAAALTGSPEYLQTRGGGTNAGFLAALYQDALQRPEDTSGQAFFTASLASGSTPGQVATAVVTSTEYRHDLVTGFYQTFLGRAADTAGLNNLFADLGQGMTDQDVLAAILGSAEYFARA